jgi:protein PhnA
VWRTEYNNIKNPSKEINFLFTLYAYNFDYSYSKYSHINLPFHSMLYSAQLSSETRMKQLPSCPKCNSEYTYVDGLFFVCPECAHEWEKEASKDINEDEQTIKDANGNPLQDGDTVTVIKDLKVKGTSLIVKVGTKVKNISLVNGDHDIDCKITGIGPMKLKSQFVKKS